MTLEVRSAYTEEVLKTLKKSTLDQANAMLETAYTTFKNKKAWLQNHERVAILEKLAKLVTKEADQFAMTIAQEGGKPLFDAKIEVSRAIDGIKLATKELMHTLKGDTIPMGFNKASEDNVAFTINEPIGVVLSISAFNHPLNLIVNYFSRSFLGNLTNVWDTKSKRTCLTTPFFFIRVVLICIINTSGMGRYENYLDLCDIRLFCSEFKTGKFKE